VNKPGKFLSLSLLSLRMNWNSSIPARSVRIGKTAFHRIPRLRRALYSPWIQESSRFLLRPFPLLPPGLGRGWPSRQGIVHLCLLRREELFYHLEELGMSIPAQRPPVSSLLRAAAYNFLTHLFFSLFSRNSTGLCKKGQYRKAKGAPNGNS